MFANSINHFRALAIIFIVASHVFLLTQPQYDAFADYFIANFLIGATIFFVFISGYLFHHIFYKRFEYGKFIKSKYKRLLIPYILLGLLPIYLYMSKLDEGWSEFFQPMGTGFFHEYLVPIGKLLMTGDFLIGYWYIPFILITFTLSPLHLAYIKLNARWQVIIFVVFFVISMLIQRPDAYLNPIHAVLYLTSAYLMGILFSQHKDVVYPKLKNQEFWFLAIALGICWIQSEYEHIGNYHNTLFTFTYKGLDYNFLQKMCLTVFFAIWLYRFEKYKNLVVTKIADTSFAVYFLHPFVMAIIPDSIIQEVSGTSEVIISHFVLFFVLYLVSFSIATVMKLILPKYSKYLIGY